MAKDAVHRSQSCKESASPHAASLLRFSPLRNSFRLPGSKKNNNNRDNVDKQITSKSCEKLNDKIGSGKHQLSVSNMAAAFQDIHQKITKSKSSADMDQPRKVSPSSFFKLDRYKLRDGGVSKKINMFNKVSNTENSQTVNTSRRKSSASIKNDNLIDENTNNKLNAIPQIVMDSPVVSSKSTLDLSNLLNPDISDEEMVIIKKHRAQGRSNSVQPLLRTLVITKEARNKRTLSLRLIPEDDLLSLEEAVERRLNLSKETNLCDTDL